MLACSAAGISAYMQMGRAEDPTFAIKTCVVGAAWPGATPDEMQRYVAQRIEDKLRETPKLDFLLTYCISDRMMTLVQLKDSVRGRAVADTWYQIRKKLDDIRGDLPSGLLGPNVDDEYGDVYSAIYAFTGEDYSLAELKRMCEQARKRLLKVKDVEKVDIIGEQQEQIVVEFSHRKLATLGITPQQIFDSVARQSGMRRSGSIDTSEDRIHVRVSRDFGGIEEIEAVPVEASGRVFRLGDVANPVLADRHISTALRCAKLIRQRTSNRKRLLVVRLRRLEVAVRLGDVGNPVEAKRHIPTALRSA